MKARKVKALLLAAVMVMSTALMGCGGSEGQENGTDNQETAEEDAGKEETAKTPKKKQKISPMPYNVSNIARGVCISRPDPSGQRLALQRDGGPKGHLSVVTS